MRRQDYSFTLIELLVVIAIIAILAATLLPVLNKQGQRSRECLSSIPKGPRQHSPAL